MPKKHPKYVPVAADRWYRAGQRVMITETGTVAYVVSPFLTPKGKMGVWVRWQLPEVNPKTGHHRVRRRHLPLSAICRLAHETESTLTDRDPVVVRIDPVDAGGDKSLRPYT